MSSLIYDISRIASLTPQSCIWSSIVATIAIYRHISNISRTLVGNKIMDHSYVVVEAPTALHLRSRLNTWLQWIGQRQLQDETRNIPILEFDAPYVRDLTVIHSTST